MDWTPDEYLLMLRRQCCPERLLPGRNELAALSPTVLTSLILRAQFGLCPLCEMQPKIETDGRGHYQVSCCNRRTEWLPPDQILAAWQGRVVRTRRSG